MDCMDEDALLHLITHTTWGKYPAAHSPLFLDKGTLVELHMKNDDKGLLIRKELQITSF